MFSKYVLFKKGHLDKRAGVWTPWTPPGSSTGFSFDQYYVKSVASVYRYLYYINITKVGPPNVSKLTRI